MNHTIYLTTGCNFICTYCYEDYKHHTSLDYDRITEIVDYIFTMDSSKKLTITFMGGEPLLKKDLIYGSVTYIERKYPDRFVRYSLTSNCSLIDDRFIEFMKEHYISIRMSFDGVREAHDRNRISKDGTSLYDTIFQNIIKIKNSGIDYSVRITVTGNTLEMIYENIVFLHENRLDNINLIIDIYLEMSPTQREIFMQQMEHVKEYYIEQMDCGTPFLFDQFNGKFLNILCDFRNKFHMCDGGVSNFKYMPNGDIYPCGFVTSDSNYVVGNIKNDLDPESGRKMAYCHYKTEPTKCDPCTIRDFCFGMKCGYMNVACTGFVNEPSELTCQFEQVYYPIVVEIVNHIAESRTLRDIYLTPLLKWVEQSKLKLSERGLKIHEKEKEYI